MAVDSVAPSASASSSAAASLPSASQATTSSALSFPQEQVFLTAASGMPYKPHTPTPGTKRTIDETLEVAEEPNPLASLFDDVGTWNMKPSPDDDDDDSDIDYDL